MDEDEWFLHWAAAASTAAIDGEEASEMDEEAKAARLLDIIAGRIETCPECGGVLTYLDDVDMSYCTDPACLWNQDAVSRAIQERYQ